MRNVKSVQIDKKKLCKELSKRGMNMASAAIKIGYSDSAIQGAAFNGRMTVTMLNLLNTFFGIKESDIAPDPEPKQEKKPEAVQQSWLTDDQFAMLASVIRRSVFNALQDWNEVRNNSPRHSA